MKKNVASQRIGAQLVSATDGSAFTGSVTVLVCGDAGTQATGSVGSGACTHEGNGYHTYAPSQAETNFDLIAFTFTGTGAVPVTVQVYTRPTTGLLAPTVDGRTLDVSAGGEAGIDLANVGSPTTTLNLSGTTISTSQTVASVSGAVGSVTGSVGSVVGAVGSVTGNVGGSVASVVGAVGSVTGNVGGNVTGSVGSVVGAVGSVTAAVTVGTINANAITASAIATDAITEIQSGLATAASITTIQGYLDTEIAAILEDTGTTIPAQIAALNNLSSAQVVSALGTGTWATAIPWNAAWDPEVQSECADALTAYGAATAVELAKVIKTGEEFTATDGTGSKDVTFTRI